ncbi:MAG: Hpt domain-containing protein [Pirellulaceae bacterium]
MSVQENERRNDESEDDQPDAKAWINRLGECTGNHHESMVAVAEGLVIEIPDVAGRLRQAISDGNAPEVQRRAHTLKSCLKYVSDGPEVTLAQRIEQYGQNQEIEAAQSVFSELEPELHTWVKRVQAWIDQQ